MTSGPSIANIMGSLKITNFNLNAPKEPLGFMKQRVYVLMKLFSVQLLTWLSVQEMSSGLARL